MLEDLLTWIKRLIYFSIFITLLLQILPHKKYEKYIRFALELIFVILVLTPVLQLVSAGDFQTQFLHRLTQERAAYEISVDFEQYEKEQQTVYEKIGELTENQQ